MSLLSLAFKVLALSERPMARSKAYDDSIQKHDACPINTDDCQGSRSVAGCRLPRDAKVCDYAASAQFFWKQTLHSMLFHNSFVELRCDCMCYAHHRRETLVICSSAHWRVSSSAIERCAAICRPVVGSKPARIQCAYPVSSMFRRTSEGMATRLYGCNRFL